MKSILIIAALLALFFMWNKCQKMEKAGGSKPWYESAITPKEDVELKKKREAEAQAKAAKDAEAAKVRDAKKKAAEGEKVPDGVLRYVIENKLPGGATVHIKGEKGSYSCRAPAGDFVRLDVPMGRYESWYFADAQPGKKVDITDKNNAKWMMIPFGTTSGRMFVTLYQETYSIPVPQALGGR